MSEKLLKAIINLLAIVAKEDEVTEDERLSIERFLIENIGKEEAAKYIRFFDRVTRSLIFSDEDQLDEVKMKIVQLSQQVNSELTQQQKLVVILNVVELILADGKITKRENELVYYIGQQFHFSDKVIDYIKAFVVNTSREKFDSTNILLIDNGDYEPPKKSKYKIHELLDGFLIFFRLPAIETYFVKYLGNHSLLLNGSPLKANKIAIFSAGSSIRSNRIDPIFYSDVITAFRSETSTAKLSFVAEDISYKFSNGGVGLQNVNIAEESGKLVGIMGGSGAGKSTLLNVLNGNAKPASGSVRINNIDIYESSKNIEGVIGYVPQDDLLMEELTVFQNLYYAAKLCFADSSKKDIIELVNKTLSSLGLTEIKDFRVGSPLQKIISGGQRKRLNIGLELLREPSVLFVDEPTSGLSSRDSENIMDLLKELSLKGKIVFVVIHQPSSDIFKMFDKLIILDVGGYQLYYGNPIEAVIYFKKIADMVDKETGACPECGNVNPEQIFNIIETKVINEYGRFTDQRKITPQQWHQHFLKRIKVPKIPEVDIIPEKTLKIPNKVSQTSIFVARDVLSKISNRQYLVVNFVEGPLLALVLAFIVKYSSPESDTYLFSDNINIPAFFFMSVIVSLFMGLTVSAEEIISDRRILKREAFLNLSRFGYLSSKTIILFVISAIQTISYILVGVLILEIKSMTFEFWLILFSTSCMANIIGLNISSAFNSAVTIYILIPILLIPQLILSGVVVNFDKLNPKISVEDKVPIIGEIMASRWAYEALMVTQYKNNPYEELFYKEHRIMAQSEYKTVYYLPKIRAELNYCHIHMGETSDDNIKSEMEDKLDLVRTEISKELEIVGKKFFPEVSKLNATQFDNNVYRLSISFLDRLRRFYNNKLNRASDDIDKKIAEMTKTEEAKAEFMKLKHDHENEAITKIVKNTTTDTRILRKDNHLIQKIYPIYMDPDSPSGPFDFRAQFYVPTKYFMGTVFETEFFNVCIIWFMTLLLFITLYLDLFRKIVSGKSRD